MEWLTIEVFDGATPASGWRMRHGDALIESAVAFGAVYWEDHEHRWGVVLELLFPDRVDSHAVDIDAFRALPSVVAALDAVPDPAAGLLVYRGRGGGSGAAVPRHPRPAPVAGAVALPEPESRETAISEEWSGTSQRALYV